MSGLAVITGASGGLGRSVAKTLLDRGWQLVLVSRDANRLCHAGARPEVSWIEADVSTEAGAMSAMELSIEKTGQIPDALVNCAGSVFISPLVHTKESQYRACLAANLDTSFFTLQAFTRTCVEAKKTGTAILVSSVAARIGITGHEAIATAKAAVEGLVRAAAATYSRHHIRINAVAPGLMRTPSTERLFAPTDASDYFDAQYPLGRHGQVQDAARSIAWLLSDDAAWITGQVLPVDGGFTAVRPVLQVRRQRKIKPGDRPGGHHAKQVS